jgi:hypothetical protein
VSVTWNFNDTVLQKGNATLPPKSVCGEAALCYRLFTRLS